LEKGVVEHKYYAENVGFIIGVMVKGGDERTELVSIITRGPGGLISIRLERVLTSSRPERRSVRVHDPGSKAKARHSKSLCPHQGSGSYHGRRGVGGVVA